MHPKVLETDIDHIKKTVDTSPLKGGGASFRTNVLIEKSTSHLIYKPHYGAAIFCFIFLAPGLAMLFFGFMSLFENNKHPNYGVVIAGLIFTAVSIAMIIVFYKPRGFDKQLGIYYSGFNIIEKMRLKDIVAIQIIGEHVKSDNGSFKCFELNLVLNDITRKNLVDHGNLDAILDDAHRLSQFLNIPIWHAKSADED